MIYSDERTTFEFILDEYQLHDITQERILMETVSKLKRTLPIARDHAYENNYTCYIAQTLNFKPIVPVKKCAMM